MQRLKILGLAFMAVVALNAIASASASAAKLEFLPTSATTFKGTGGPRTLETVSGTKITCTSSISEGTIKPPLGGTFTITFKGCKMSGTACTGEAAKEPKEQITTKGTLELAYANKTEPDLSFVRRTEEVHYECLIVLILERITTCRLVQRANTDTKIFTLTVTQTKGKQTCTKWEKENGTKESGKSEASISGGAFEETGEESTKNEIETAILSEIMG